MTRDDDMVIARLSALSSPPPDAARAARVRARCCAELARGRRRSQHANKLSRLTRRVLAPALLALVGAACFADMVDTAVRTLTT